MAPAVTEWVSVTDDISIIARESGEVWFHNRDKTKSDVDPFTRPMTGMNFARARRSPARVSAVSPDWLIATTRVFPEAIGLR